MPDDIAKIGDVVAHISLRSGRVIGYGPIDRWLRVRTPDGKKRIWSSENVMILKRAPQMPPKPRGTYWRLGRAARLALGWPREANPYPPTAKIARPAWDEGWCSVDERYDLNKLIAGITDENRHPET